MNSKMALAASSFGSRGSSKTYALDLNTNRVRVLSHFISTVMRPLEPFNTYLVVLIQPEEGEIGDSYWLPVILDLLACTVYYVRDFVSHDEFQVLRHTKSSQVWKARIKTIRRDLNKSSESQRSEIANYLSALSEQHDRLRGHSMTFSGRRDLDYGFKP